MASRCSNCNRPKLFGRGWVPEGGELYCPTCWADLLARRKEAKRREEEERARRAEEAKRERAQIESRIGETRRQLEAYSSRQMPLPPEYVTPSSTLARYALERMDWVVGQAAGKSVAKLKETLEEYIEPVARPILEVLNRIAFQDTTANVNDLIQLCLQLTMLRDIRLEYQDGVKYPVDILIHLGEVDRTTTLTQLSETACDPNTDPRARVASIMALGRIGDQRAVEPLLGILKEGKDDWGSIIPGAACALVDLSDERAVMPIIRAMGQHFYTGSYGDWTARDYIAERLAALIRPGSELYQEVCRTWRASKEAPRVATPWPTAGASGAVTSVLGRILLECGEHEAVDIAAEWARSEKNDVALEGTEALANLSYEEAVDVLCSIVTTPRRVVVGSHDEGDAWDIPDYAPNTEQRIVAAKALAQRGGPKAMATLRGAASDDDAKVRAVIEQLLRDL